MDSPWQSSCEHPVTQLVRIIDTLGRTHVMQQCTHCHLNARGPGCWVEWCELTVPIDSLPLAYDARRGRQLPPTK